MRVLRVSARNRSFAEHLDPFDVMDMLLLPGSFALAAVPEEKKGKKTVAGGLIICRIMRYSLDIHWLYVDDRIRNKGVGELLLSEAFQLANKLGKPRVRALISDELIRKAVCPWEESYLRDRLFEREEEQGGIWRGDLRLFSIQPYLKERPEKLSSVSLKDLDKEKRDKLLPVLAKVPEGYMICDPVSAAAVIDKDVSMILRGESGIRGALLVYEGKDTVYPIYFLAVDEAAEKDLIISALSAAMEKYGPEKQLCIQLSAEGPTELLDRIISTGSVRNSMLIADTSDFFDEEIPVEDPSELFALKDEQKTVSRDIGETKTVSLKELKSSPLMKLNAGEAEALGAFSPLQVKNALMACFAQGHTGVYRDIMDMRLKELDWEVSCVVRQESGTTGLLLVRRLGEALRVEYLYAFGEGYQKQLLDLLGYGFRKALEKYPEDTELILPTGSGQARDLIGKLLKDR